MGGITTNRKDNPIKLMTIDSKERGKYSDPIGKKICGVETKSIQLPTWLRQWRIEKCVVEKTSTIEHFEMRLSGSDHEAAVAA